MGAIVFFWQAHPKSRKLLLNLIACHQGCLLSVAFCSGEELLCTSATYSPGSNYTPALAISCTEYYIYMPLWYAALWYAAQRQSPAVIIVQASVYL